MRVFKKSRKRKVGSPTLKDELNKIKYKLLDKYVARYNKDLLIILTPVLITALIIFSFTSLKYVKNNQFVDYQNKAINYHENITFEDNQSIVLTDSELKGNDIIFKYKFNNLGAIGDMPHKKIYINITDNISEANPLFQGELNPNNSEITIKTSDIKPRYQSAIEEKKDYELYIYYYSIDDLIELSYSNPVEMSVITYDDLYVYEDISDYFEPNKSVNEMEREVKYIRRKYLTDNQISKVFTTNSKQIIKVFKKPIEQQHEELGLYYKMYKEQYKNYIEMLKLKGITDDEIKIATNRSQDINVILNNLQKLEYDSDVKVQQINSGYMKELNINYNYSTEKINELTRDKTAVEIKKILEEEINKNKEEANKTKEKLTKKVNELKKKKVDNKKIKKIMDNKKLNDKQKLEELNRLK